MQKKLIALDDIETFASDSTVTDPTENDADTPDGSTTGFQKPTL